MTQHTQETQKAHVTLKERVRTLKLNTAAFTRSASSASVVMAQATECLSDRTESALEPVPVPPADPTKKRRRPRFGLPRKEKG